MSFHHTVKKLIDTQKKIEKHIKKEMDESALPPELVEKSDKCAEWLIANDEKLSSGEVAVYEKDIDPVEDYANALFTDKDMFHENVKSEIVEFNELTKQLFQELKEPERTVRD